VDLSSSIAAYLAIGAASILAAVHFKRARRTQIVAGATIAVALVVVLNVANFLGTASADYHPTIRPNDVAATYGMPVDVASTLKFGVRPAASDLPAYVINPYRPRSVNGSIIVTFFGTTGVPAVFEVPNDKLHLRQTVSASQPTSLTLVLDKKTDLGKRRLLAQSDCNLSLETAATACKRSATYSTELGATLTNRGLGSIVEDELTDVTLVVPANIYRMLREDRGEG
jgi:hypothetical protein